jgi:hypothetical protein
MYVCMYTFINTYIQTLHMYIHYITNMHAHACTHTHTHTLAGDSPQQSDTTNRLAAINSLKWQEFILPPPPDQPWSQGAQWVSGIFPWGLSNRRPKLTSQAQSALIVRIGGVLILIPHSFTRRRALWPIERYPFHIHTRIKLNEKSIKPRRHSNTEISWRL